MAWVRLDDQLYLNEKIDDAGEEAALLFVFAICYCNHMGTDGKIPRNRVPKLAYPLKALKLADRLVEVGLFAYDGDDFIIPKFLEWNDSAEVVAQRKEATKQRVNAFRNKTRNAVTPPVTDPPGNSGGTPSPSSSAFENLSSSSSKPVLVPEWVDEDEFSLACWKLTQRKFESETVAGRGPTTNPEGWLRTTYLGYKRTYQSAPKPTEPTTPEQLADWFEPPAKPKVNPEDSTARAQAAKHAENEAKRQRESAAYVAPASKPDFQAEKQRLIQGRA